MKKRFFVTAATVVALSVLVLVLFVPAAKQVNASSHILHVAEPKSNGGFDIFVKRGTGWEKAGNLVFSQFLKEQRIDIGPFVKKGQKAEIRIVKSSGAAAHIDVVALGKQKPVSLNGAQGAAVKKLVKRDLDLADAAGRLDLTFDKVDKTVLSIKARIEAKEILKRPFMFPAGNREFAMHTHAKFYPYQLKADGKGLPSTIAKPFMRKFCIPKSGHPAGYTYAWVGNDNRYLYVKLDFTPDNTVDGDKDYAKLHVKYGNRYKAFKIYAANRRWGRTQFTYTDKVSYQHKTYTFRVPLRQFGVRSNKKEKALGLAFELYGTAATGDTFPALAYGSQGNQYMAAYLDVALNRIMIKRVAAEGTVVGSAVTVSEVPLSVNLDKPSIAYDTLNNRFLIVWAAQTNSNGTRDIFGQVVNADGTLYQNNFGLSTSSSNQFQPNVAFSPVAGRYMVVWRDNRESTFGGVYGQLVGANGSLVGSNVAIRGIATNNSAPVIAYGNNRFFVVWDYTAGAGGNILGQQVNGDGTLSGSPIAITTHASMQLYPALSFDAVNNRFLVAFTDYRYSPRGFGGQIVGGTGALVGGNTLILTNNTTQNSPVVAASSASGGQRFLVCFHNTNDVYGQFVNESGVGVSLTNIAITAAYENNPSVAFSPVDNSYLVAYEKLALTLGVSRVSLGVTGNNLPSAPVLTSPVNGATGVAVSTTLAWNPSTDADGDNVSYAVYISTNASFSGTTPYSVAATSTGKGVVYAGMGIAALFALGIGFLGHKRKRLLAILLILLLFIAFGACSDSDGDKGSGTQYAASGLLSGTTYYWKVIASDGKGGSASSATWQFTTQ